MERCFPRLNWIISFEQDIHVVTRYGHFGVLKTPKVSSNVEWTARTPAKGVHDDQSCRTVV